LVIKQNQDDHFADVPFDFAQGTAKKSKENSDLEIVSKKLINKEENYD